jgi:uncharacterized protein involved in exopolysaccharide biosynthesis
MEEKKTREIDLLSLVIIMLQEWQLLCKFCGVAAVIGIIVALCTPKYFKADVVLAPEMSSGGLGLTDNLADMAANFGIELGGKSSMDAIYPELYPDIFSSTEFIMQLFDVPVRLKDDNIPRTYIEHLEKDQKVPFWTYPKMWLGELLKPKDPLADKKGNKDGYKISRKDADLCDAIRNAILCSIDKKTSVISISVTDQDPLVAAILADTLQQRLQTYITNYRTSKARIDYEYYQQLTSAAKDDYEKSRRQYAGISDATTNVSLRSVELKLQDMENDMQLKFNTYTNLNNQLQAAKARVQEKTPAFTIIETPIMPYRASSTPRALIVLVFIFLGGICDALWVLYGRKWYGKKKSGNRK